MKVLALFGGVGQHELVLTLGIEAVDRLAQLRTNAQLGHTWSNGLVTASGTDLTLDDGQRHLLQSWNCN